MVPAIVRRRRLSLHESLRNSRLFRLVVVVNIKNRRQNHEAKKPVEHQLTLELEVTQNTEGSYDLFHNSSSGCLTTTAVVKIK